MSSIKNKKKKFLNKYINNFRSLLQTNNETIDKLIYVSELMANLKKHVKTHDESSNVVQCNICDKKSEV